MINTDIVTKSKDDKKLESRKLYVRYMVSLRCKLIVREELNKLKIKHSILPYGAIKFLDDVTQKELNALRRNLKKAGLELMDLQESKMIDRIINTIKEVIHYFDVLPKLNYSEVISNNLSEANESVLKIFSEVVGMSVIQFIVLQKIERIKELLLYDDKPLSEIAYILNYKNERYLIAQFKKYTGLTPEYFRGLKKVRKNIAFQSS